MNERAEKVSDFFWCIVLVLLLWLTASTRNYKTKLTHKSSKRKKIIFMLYVCMRSENCLSQQTIHTEIMYNGLA